MLLHNFSLDAHSQLRTMVDGWHGFLSHAIYSISEERLEISEDVYLLLTTRWHEITLFLMAHAKALYFDERLEISD